MHFLSYLALTGAAIGSLVSGNPLDTPDQRSLDELAAKFHQTHPCDDLISEIRQTFLATAEQYGYNVVGSPILQKRLDVAMDEFSFSCLQRVVNDDPAYPKVYYMDTAPRENVFGGRFGYDNTDCTYRHIPVNSSYSYIIRGKRTQLADVTFSLQEDWELTPSTSILTKEELVVGPDGSYTITVNSTASESPNHI